jgi:hypothetical protein
VAFTTNPYVGLGEVKLALGTPSTTTNDDAFLQDCINEAQSDIDEYLGYRFETDGTQGSPATRVYDGNDGEFLYIDDCQQVVQVIETTYNVLMGAQGAWTLGSTQTLDITADILLQPDNVTPGNRLTRISGLPFSPGKQNYVVKGVFGYATVPANMVRACKRLAIHYYKQRSAGYSDKPADSQYGGTLKFSASMPPDVCEILDRMRHTYFFAR